MAKKYQLFDVLYDVHNSRAVGWPYYLKLQSISKMPSVDNVAVIGLLSEYPMTCDELREVVEDCGFTVYEVRKN